MAFFTVRKIVLRKFKVWPEQKSVKTSHSTTSMKSTNFNQKKNCSIDVYFIKFWSTSFWRNDNFEEHFHLSSNQIKKYNFKLYLIPIKYFPICPNWKDFYDKFDVCYLEAVLYYKTGKIVIIHNLIRSWYYN